MILQMHIEYEHVCGSTAIDETLPEKVLRNDQFFNDIIENGNQIKSYYSHFQ